MKAILLILTLALPCAAQEFSNKLFDLIFDYDAAESTNVTLRAHASSDSSIALTNWVVVESNWITEGITNGIATLVSSNKVLAVAPVQYFVASASNEWGIAFSDVRATRPPRPNVRLWLR